MGKTLTGFHLKVIGVISMVFDHLLQFFSFLGVPGWFGWIGRIAAPIFLFESSEGFIHTSNRRKYMFRLLLGFWIMGILNGILNAYFSTGGLIINNIFGTLFLGTVYMQSMDYFKQKQIGKGLLWFIVPLLISALPLVVFSSPDILSNPAILIGFQIFNLIVPSLMMTEGGFLFVLLAVAFYLFHGKKWLQISAIGVVALISAASYNFRELFGVNHQWMMILAAIPIVLYNGEKGRGMRNFFYIFYPAHIAIFAIISFFMQR